MLDAGNEQVAHSPPLEDVLRYYNSPSTTAALAEKTVSIGAKAVRSPCAKITRRSDNPLARASFTYSLVAPR